MPDEERRALLDDPSTRDEPSCMDVAARSASSPYSTFSQQVAAITALVATHLVAPRPRMDRCGGAALTTDQLNGHCALWTTSLTCRL